MHNIFLAGVYLFLEKKYSIDSKPTEYTWYNRKSLILQSDKSSFLQLTKETSLDIGHELYDSNLVGLFIPSFKRAFKNIPHLLFQRLEWPIACELNGEEKVEIQILTHNR